MASKPQDHRPPKSRPKTITVQGVSLTVDPDVFDDLDMLEDVYAIQSGSGDGPLRIVPLLERICGDAYPQVKKSLRDPETGRIPMEKVGGWLAEVMREAAPNS